MVVGAPHRVSKPERGDTVGPRRWIRVPNAAARVLFRIDVLSAGHCRGRQRWQVSL